MHHTEALVLKRKERNESDWMVTVLTRDFGKLRLLAQGARKHGAKLQGHLEPGSIADVSFVLGKNGYRLTTARLREFFPGIRGSFSKLRALVFVLRDLDANLWEDGDNAGELFRLVSATLAALERAEHLRTLRRVLAWFQVRLFSFLGVLPSDESPEAARCRALLQLGARALAEIGELEVSEEVLEQELAWLAGRVSSTVHVPPPVTFKDSAIYFL